MRRGSREGPETKAGLDEDAYVGDREQRAIVEREFQTTIGACIDIAALLCKAMNEDVPADNAEKFALLARRDVLSAKTADRMKEAAGFRNVLAHQYGGDIDDASVYRSLQTDLDWFPSFLRDGSIATLWMERQLKLLRTDEYASFSETSEYASFPEISVFERRTPSGGTVSGKGL